VIVVLILAKPLSETAQQNRSAKVSHAMIHNIKIQHLKTETFNVCFSKKCSLKGV